MSPYPPVALENPKPSSFSQPPCETSSRPSHLLDLRHHTTTRYRHTVVAEDVEPSSVTSPVVNIESLSHQANTEHPSASFSFSFLGCRCFFVVPIRRLRRAFRFLALCHQSLFASSARFCRRLVDKHCRTATQHRRRFFSSNDEVYRRASSLCRCCRRRWCAIGAATVFVDDNHSLLPFPSTSFRRCLGSSPSATVGGGWEKEIPKILKTRFSTFFLFFIFAIDSPLSLLLPLLRSASPYSVSQPWRPRYTSIWVQTLPKPSPQLKAKRIKTATTRVYNNRQQLIRLQASREDGSSEIQLGLTRVMGFVTGQLVQPYRDRPNEGTLAIYTEFSPMADPSFESGRPGESGYSTHFGTAEAARWFLTHEMGTINDCLHKHQGFRLRLVGHLLVGAIASILAIMIRKKTCDELGFSPDIVTAVRYGTPPCVSRDLADSCSDFVTTVLLIFFGDGDCTMQVGEYQGTYKCSPSDRPQLINSTLQVARQIGVRIVPENSSQVLTALATSFHALQPLKVLAFRLFF
ncbi:unnamed protein product [Lactuca virosa]|uniref:Fungal lipase-type domain-containing protein n=1 Tax=Lactuca virosa TaxID=75947 RepID=A0AAU9LTE7_9ASTR|nr:unnamed protein product [Lactuca virosa]